ncbi:MAG: ABC transporter ATP-binding protein [Thermoguttaceae bacterium]|jgi:ABC-type polysaccharide/polyol phosphate transport system ATPase subunit
MKLIELSDAGLLFRVRRHGRTSLKDYMLHGLFRGRQQNTIEVQALEHVDLSVDQGERVGIIGHNGAGKSTLLKLLAGIYPPTTGRRRVTGRVSALFDISLGFEPEASGWDNIRYRSYLQGETPTSLQARMQNIAEFSELGQFLDMPVRYYSSGMLVRLAFSVATAIEPEILVVDEVLSAGDLSFQAKARQRMRALISSAQAVVVVSHDLDSLAKLCNRIVWLDHGRIRMAGPPQETVAAYVQHIADTSQRQAA